MDRYIRLDAYSSSCAVAVIGPSGRRRQSQALESNARARDGSCVRVPVQQTRGLNRKHNHTLKRIFKGAATTMIGRARREDPLYWHYQVWFPLWWGECCGCNVIRDAKEDHLQSLLASVASRPPYFFRQRVTG